MSPLPDVWQARTRRLQPVAAVVAGLLILIQIGRWGGTTSPGPLFALGLVVLSGLVVGFGVLLWWLYASPLPGARIAPSSLSAGAQQFLASGVVLGGMLFMIGLFWDELWHRRFGGFLDDFLWPPHLLLYGSILLFTVFAGAGIYLTLRKPGSLRERFRSEPTVGLIGLVSSFLLCSIPSDELWHRIYGEDISAWSLPHILLLGGASAIMLAGVTLQLSLLPRTGWQRLAGFRWQEGLILLLLTWSNNLLIQIGMAEWDAIRDPNLPHENAGIWARPEWLLPVVGVFLALFTSHLAVYALRRAGVATLVAGLVLGVRILLISVIGNADDIESRMTVNIHVLFLAPALAVDAWYWLRADRPKSGGALVGGALAAAAVFFAVDLPIIGNTLLFPRINAATLPGMIGYGLPMAVIGAWLGSLVGTWLAASTGRLKIAPGSERRVTLGTLGILAAAMIIIFILILISPPPTG